MPIFPDDHIAAEPHGLGRTHCSVRPGLDASISNSQVRWAAKRAGLAAKKGGRWREGTCDNHGGYMLPDPTRNIIVAGQRFDLTPEDVLRYCDERAR